ncbi:MAG: DUF4268 domain-containing protein [Acidobacteria bacterium]|nr:DUF4268 domain-containing protein [Acidobacteriota bacterium]
MKLGKLEKIDLREFWKHEAFDFTDWLSQEENLAMLSDEIGIGISLIKTEASVGRFNVDILAEEENTGRQIVIENQLEVTDHDHLGKLITYGSGFDAEIIIWIVKEVRDEHKQAIDWLNEHTDEKINLFAIKMELWRIDQSPCAPKFQIISKPNDWVKALKKSVAQSNLSETKLMQLEFWTKFREYFQDRKTKFRLRKPYPQHWYDISIGYSKAYISLIVDTQNDQLRCELYIPDSKELFYGLSEYKDEIDNKIDCELDWMELEGKKASRIKTICDAEINDTDNWEGFFDWLISKTQLFEKVFSVYIRKIKS